MAESDNPGDHSGIMNVSQELLIDVLKLPQDTRILQVNFDHATNMVGLILCHADIPNRNRYDNGRALNPRFEQKDHVFTETKFKSWE